MSTTSAILESRPQDENLRGGIFLLIGATCVAILSAILAGWLPLGFSIVTVFLFAGPHNWIEARYFLSRMPARWGKLRPFFITAFTGIFGLTAFYAVMPSLGERFAWTEDTWFLAVAGWNTIFVLWILALVQMRSRQNPRREWGWTVPVAFFLMALTWIDPYSWGLALVYAHPMMAFWILDRELKRSRPQWRPTFHRVLCLLPIVLVVLWWQLANAPNLPGHRATPMRIVQHAGADILEGVSTHLLVATHTFLEMLHYGVWLIVIPLIAFRYAPWKTNEVPLAKRSATWNRVVIGILIVGGLMALTLWGAFLADYPITRDVYFTVAMLHVLAEAPFLLRAL